MRYYNTAMNRCSPSRKGRCQVCKHPDRQAIELAKLSGSSYDNVADRFGVHRDALWRHFKWHLDADDRAQLLVDIPLKQLATKAAQENGDLLGYLALVRSTVLRESLGAAADHDRTGTAALAGRATEILTKIGQITGEAMRLLPMSITNNTVIFNSPQFAQLETMLIERLAKYPDALREVVDGLHQLEAEAAPEGALPVIASPTMSQFAQGAP
jgi:hypothetical protein